MTISDFKKDTSLTSIPENSSNLTNLDLEPVIAYGQKHPDVVVVLDKAAASKLSK